LPGWDAKEIARISTAFYGGLTGLFEKHGWPERGSQMMPKVQKRVAEQYGSIAEFVKKHS
jgi:hypothetical protein